MKIKIKDIVELLIIFLLALFIYRVVLVWFFGNPYPLVVVVSGSMMHKDNIEIKHYQFLERNFGYNKSYIDSWPLKNGFGVGDILVVVKTNDLRIGDVVVFKNRCQNIPIAHRIIAINEDSTFQTKGDNNYEQNISPCYNEKSISKEDIYGKVVLVIPKIGIFRYFVFAIFGI